MDQIEFGTDGIRQTAGIWPINIIGTQKVGLGVGRYLFETNKKSRVIIGRDTRISGDMLFVALSSGLLSFGIEVIDIGVITTAGIAYLTRAKQADLGIIISASHNHWTENGIKLIGQDGFKLADEIEERIEKYVNENSFSTLQEYGRIYHNEDWVEDYIQYLIKPFKSFDFR
jgi:phosphoglucosamine mutase